MVFSDTATNQGIIQECEFLVFGGEYGAISGNTKLLQTFTRLTNRALDKVVMTLLKTDGNWQWDDNNNVDMPIGQTNLVDSQGIYILATKHLQIVMVEVLDSAGDFYVLKPYDISELRKKGISPEEYFETDGQPEFYNLTGNTIELKPAPAAAQVTLANGLRVHYKQGGNYFTTSDTTKEPGFSSLYHQLIPLHASYMYASANDMKDKAERLLNDLTTQDASFSDFTSKRDKSSDPRMSIRPIRSR